MKDHPRIRGEHGTQSRLLTCRLRIIPAYAGSTSTPAPPTVSRRDHPRIRGEHRPVQPRPGGGAGSSPHTRGARHRHPRPACRQRIIPAYAGSTRRSRSPRARPADHPRIRGEHCAIPVPPLAKFGSSPHTRGARPLRRNLPHRPRIIPAYAGSTSISTSRRREIADHPRIRGEHVSGCHCKFSLMGSSPHTRGAPKECASRHPLRPDHPRIRGEHRRRPSRLGRLRRIIPAYAGSTTRAPSSPSSERDHPRIRGEHATRRIAGSE